MSRDLDQLRADIAVELALLNERDLRATGRIVKAFLAHAKGEEPSPFEAFGLVVDADRAVTEDGETFAESGVA